MSSKPKRKKFVKVEKGTFDRRKLTKLEEKEKEITERFKKAKTKAEQDKLFKEAGEIMPERFKIQERLRKLKESKEAPAPEPDSGYKPPKGLIRITEDKDLESADMLVYQGLAEDGYYGFESKKDSFRLDGMVEQPDKRIHLKYLINKSLGKGQTTKKLIAFFKFLVKKKVVNESFKIVLYADASFGMRMGAKRGKGDMPGLVGYYQKLGFKKFGQVAYGNQPMETSMKNFLKVNVKK